MLKKKYDEEPMHIFASVYIRAILGNVPKDTRTALERKIIKTLDDKEAKFYKTNKEEYSKIMAITNECWLIMKERRKFKVFLEPALVCSGLYAECRNTFKKRYKLKETMFDKLLAQQNKFSEHELTSYEVVTELMANSYGRYYAQIN